MRYLITGVSGFVGGHYLKYLSTKRAKPRIIGIDGNEPKWDFLANSFRKNIEFHKRSLLNRNFVFALIKKFKPDYIVNLASYSSVDYSWKHPAECFVNNTTIFLNLVEAVRKAKIKTKILSVGSSEEYGIVETRNIPLTEKTPLNPTNPYAVARVSQEQISRIYVAAFKIPIICTRSFNHIGPRQRDIFAVSSFAKQIIKSKKGKIKKIVCGNLDVIRDFIDVRDVIKAYDLLLQKGRTGEVYNVCSGEGHKLSEVLGMLQEIANTNIPVKGKAELMRPVDNPVIVGSSGKLKKDTGFRQEFDLFRSLTDILEYWQSVLATKLTR